MLLVFARGGLWKVFFHNAKFLAYGGLGRLGSGLIVGLGGLNTGQGEVSEALAHLSRNSTA